MIRNGNHVRLGNAELSIYRELGRNEDEPTTVVELNAGLLRGIDYWERREAAGFHGSRTFIELLRGLLVVDGLVEKPKEDEP